MYCLVFLLSNSILLFKVGIVGDLCLSVCLSVSLSFDLVHIARNCC